MIIVGMAEKDTAIVYTSEAYAKAEGLPYAEFDSIPEGSGLLKTDLKILWWESTPKPEESEPTTEETMLELLADQEYRLCMIELGLN